MEKSKLDKLTAALEQAGYEVKTLEEEELRNGHSIVREKTGDILLRITPVKEKEPS